MDWLSRTELLLGQEKLDRLRRSSVLVMGLGGVGAYAAELICRAGVGTMTIADGDVVHPTNRNRQLPALVSNQGKSKASVMQERLLDINPELNLTVIEEYVRDERMLDVLRSQKFDYVVDAIDTISPKLFLMIHCLARRRGDDDHRRWRRRPSDQPQPPTPRLSEQPRKKQGERDAGTAFGHQSRTEFDRYRRICPR